MKKIGFLIMMVILLQGCIWVEDDHENCCWNEMETIVYVNQTGYEIDNYIDGSFVGTVIPRSDLAVYGEDYQNYHTFYSATSGGEREWGPTEFYVQDGETFKIYLEDGGLRDSWTGIGSQAN